MFSNKRQKLAALEIHQRKLTDLVSQMLARADEIDQASVPYKARLPDKWHESFAITCREIISLSEAVTAITSLIKKGDIKATEQSILRSTEIAQHLVGKLDQFAAQLK